jgi:hypothetical protein
MVTSSADVAMAGPDWVDQFLAMRMKRGVDLRSTTYGLGEMRNRSVWLSLAAMSVAGSLTACDLSGGGGGGGNGTPDADAGDVGDEADVSDEQQPLTYHYVMVADEEPPETSNATSTSGADINAIELVVNGDGVFASRLEDWDQGPGDNDFADNATHALGEPEAGCPTSGSATYFSMGGEGGYVIVSFPSLAEIHTGDTIRVYECGATEELFDAFVGVAASPDSEWIRVITSGTGVQEGTVPTLE